MIEYFDSGDDPLYDAKEAVKHLIMAAAMASAIAYAYRKQLSSTEG